MYKRRPTRHDDHEDTWIDNACAFVVVFTSAAQEAFGETLEKHPCLGKAVHYARNKWQATFQKT
jgi:hypothetical protein